MKVKRARLSNAVATVVEDNKYSKEFAREIAAYLMSEKRVGELDSILRDVTTTRAQDGVVEVLAYSAFGLSEVSKSDIEARVREVYPKATKIIITSVHDPDVVGGVRLELPGQQLDLSIRAKLNKFKQLTTQHERSN